MLVELVVVEKDVEVVVDEVNRVESEVGVKVVLVETGGVVTAALPIIPAAG